MKEKWTVTDVVYAIQFTLFWLTAVGGFVTIIMTIVKIVTLPLWAVIVAYVSLVAIQMLFLVLNAKSDSGEVEIAKNSASEEEEQMEKELQEYKELKAHLKREVELRENRL